MIDSDMLKYVIAELIPNERVLWAEKTDLEKRNAWISKYVKSNKKHAPFHFIVSLFLVYLVSARLVELVETDNVFFAILGILFLALFALLFLAATFICSKSYFGNAPYDKQRRFGGYVLTDKRLLIFDFDYKLISSRNARGIKWAKPYKQLGAKFKWETTNLMLSPIGDGLFKFAELYFLHNFKTAEQHINKVIKEKPNE